MLKLIIILDLDLVTIFITHERLIKSGKLIKWLNINISIVPCWQFVGLVDISDIKQYRSTKCLQKKQKWCLHSEPPPRKKKAKMFP